MTTGQPDPLVRAPRPLEEVAVSDLTARARIREAALRRLAEEGYERATIRGIARTAGVSPGLLRHHFGSKQDLRRSCDEYVSEQLRRINARLLDDPGDGARAPRAVDHRIRAALVTAMAAGIPLLHEQLSRAMGTDIFGPVLISPRATP
jgi:AcrR family transcriptional regulator